MGKYDHYEELEEQAYRDSVAPKKKPKKVKKGWSKNENENESRKDYEYRKKDNKYISNHPKRI
jgi:hypothetical protein